MALGIVNTNSVTSGSSGGGSGSGGGGIEPSNMRQLTILAANNGVSIKFQEPDDTIIDGQTLCSWKGVKIVVKQGDYPEDENDGLEILDCQERGKYINEFFRYTDLVNGNEYYVQAFPYSDNYVYNRNRKNSAKIVPSQNCIINLHFTAKEAYGLTIKASNGKGKDYTSIIDENGNANFEIDTTGIFYVGGQKFNLESLGQTISKDAHLFGYDWNNDESDMESSISYPEGVTNVDYSPVQQPIDNSEIDLGDWSTFHNFVGCRPVMMDFEGNVQYELDHDDQNLKKGGEGSDIKRNDILLNAMVEFPKRYFKRWETTESYSDRKVSHFRVCEYKLGETWKCFPWMVGENEENAVENDYIYLPMYNLTITDGTQQGEYYYKMRSLSDQTRFYSSYITRLELALKNMNGGEWNGWGIIDYSDLSMIMDYMYMMAKSTDIIKHWGKGYYSTYTKTGATTDKGPYYFSATGSKKFMWMEDIYGPIPYMLPSVAVKAGKARVKGFPPYDTYTNTGALSTYTLIEDSSFGAGYISKITYTEYGVFPTESKGQSGKFMDAYASASSDKTLVAGASNITLNDKTEPANRTFFSIDINTGGQKFALVYKKGFEIILR